MLSGRRRRSPVLAAVLCLAGLSAPLVGCAVSPGLAGSARPADWAQAIRGEPAIANLHRVSATLYRSAQPTPEGLLSGRPVLFDPDPPLGSVLSLRQFHADVPAAALAESSLDFARIPMLSWHLEDEDTVRFLRFVTNPANQPVLVHCRHGADRTGAMIAVYRVVVEGWTKDVALREMTQGGFGFHPVWRNLVKYVSDLDVDDIRARLAAP